MNGNLIAFNSFTKLKAWDSWVNFVIIFYIIIFISINIRCAGMHFCCTCLVSLTQMKCEIMYKSAHILEISLHI